MSAVLALLGVTLVVAGFLWRLREIEDRTTAGAQVGGTGVAAQPRRSSASKRPPKVAGTKLTWAEAIQANAPSALAQSLRRSDRVLLKIPVEVSGTDLEGISFTERTRTQDINRNGASLVLRSSLLPGGQIMVKNIQTGQSCRFRARRAGQDLPGGGREWGVECLDPAPTFWGISFAESPSDPNAEEESVSSLLECPMCHCRELAKFPLSEYRTVVRRGSSTRHCVWCGIATEWKFAIVDEGAGARASSAPNGQVEPALLGLGAEGRREERPIARLADFDETPRRARRVYDDRKCVKIWCLLCCQYGPASRRACLPKARVRPGAGRSRIPSPGHVAQQY